MNYNKGEIRDLHYGLIHASNFEILDVEILPFIIETKTPKKINFWQEGDLFLADASEDRKDCGKGVEILNNNRKKIVGGLHTIQVRDNNNLCCPFFKAFYTASDGFHKFTYKYSEGIKVFSLKPSLFKYLIFYYPSKSEQQKIVKFLLLISKKITITENKILTLKKYKKGIVLKLLNPTINNWKNGSHFGSQLACFLEPYKALATDNEGLVHATLSKDGVSRKIDRYNRDFLVKNNDKKYKIVDKDDLIYNPSNLKFGVICINKYDKCIVSPIYETFKIKKISPALLEAIVTSKSFINYALKYEEGTVYERRSVSPDDLLKIKLVINQENEINFKKIFQLIYLKTSILERMLNQLEKHKKYLLNNMFI